MSDGRQSKLLDTTSQPAPDSFGSLWAESLAFYEKETGHSLLQSPPSPSSIPDVRECTSTDDLFTSLQLVNSKYGEFRNRNKKFWSALDSVARISGKLLDVGGEVASNAGVPCGKVPFAIVGILISASRGVSQTYDVVDEFFTKIYAALARIELHFDSETPPSPAIKQIFAKMLVLLVKVFALVTKYLDREVNPNSSVKKGFRLRFPKRISHYKDALLGNTEVQDILQELDKCTSLEALQTAAETHAASKSILVDTRKISSQQTNDLIYKWLSPPDISQMQNSMCSARLDGTGAWFLDDRSDFSRWKRSKNGVLWIHGKPGSGKSVLCSLAIEDLTDEPGLAYFYFDFRDSSKRTVYGLLSSLVSQFSARSSNCHKLLNELYANRMNRLRPSNEQLLQCLEGMLRTFFNAYVVIDALDECPESTRYKELYSVLQQLSRLDDTGIHLLLTSRWVSDIQRGLASVMFRQLISDDESLYSGTLDLEKLEGHARDLEYYISQEISKIGTWNDGVISKAKKSLVSKANGMFLLASLQSEALRRSRQTAIDEVLETLPTSLNDTYKRILEEIHPSNTAVAVRILQCIAFSERPLSPEELAEIFTIKFSPTGDAQMDASLRERDAEASLLLTCSTLIQIVDSVDRRHDHDQATTPRRVVQFSHLTIRDYLVSDRHLAGSALSYRIDMRSAHLTLARLCVCSLTYIGSKSFPPFAEYAATYWTKHVFCAVATEEQGFKGVLHRMLHPTSSPAMTRWRRMKVWDKEYDEHARSLYCAAEIGLEDYIRAWLDCAAAPSLDTNGGPHGTALCASARYGNLIAVKVLLEYGATVDCSDALGHTPLHFAAATGNIALTQLLLNHAAPIDARNGHGATPLHLAAIYGHQDLSELLLRSSANLEARTNLGASPLFVAAENGSVDVACLLLEHDADVNARGPDRGTPLFVASQNGYEDMVFLLLQHGAAHDACIASMSTPMHIAAQSGRTEVVRVLLEHDAQVDPCDRFNGRPLLFASHSGHLDVVRLLVDAGADVCARTINGFAPIHVAAQNGHQDVVRYLADQGADAECRNSSEQTPLYMAAQYGHIEVAQLLLDSGVDVDACDPIGTVPLYIATQFGRTEMCKLLLKNGANVNALDRQHWTPLHVACQQGYLGIASLLLEHGALFDQCSIDGHTALHVATRYNHLDVVVLLLDKGASAGICDKANRTALHVAAQNNGCEIIRVLLERRGVHLDIEAREEIGGTPLFCASQNGHSDAVRRLLEVGARVDGRTYHQVTPLCIAAREGHLDVVRLLLDHGANFARRDGFHSLPLHIAAQNGHLAVVRLLLEHGTPVDARSRFGATALYCAAQEGHADVVRLVLEHSAGVDVHNTIGGYTPLVVACASGHIDVVRTLIAHGANVNAFRESTSPDVVALTPLQAATRNGHVDVVQLLLENGAEGDNIDVGLGGLKWSG